MLSGHCGRDSHVTVVAGSHVSVDTAYTESLQVFTQGDMISFGLLDSMNGHAHLQSGGGDVTVEGLDGSAQLDSQGGAIQVCFCRQYWVHATISMLYHCYLAAASCIRHCFQKVLVVGQANEHAQEYTP